VELAGSWPDLPSLEEIRKADGSAGVPVLRTDAVEGSPDTADLSQDMAGPSHDVAGL
jgi:hypothetical protein